MCVCVCVCGGGGRTGRHCVARAKLYQIVLLSEKDRTSRDRAFRKFLKNNNVKVLKSFVFYRRIILNGYYVMKTIAICNINNKKNFFLRKIVSHI